MNIQKNSIVTFSGSTNKYQILGLGMTKVIARLVEGTLKADESTRVSKLKSEINAVVIENSHAYTDDDCAYDIDQMGDQMPFVL